MVYWRLFFVFMFFSVGARGQLALGLNGGVKFFMPKLQSNSGFMDNYLASPQFNLSLDWNINSFNQLRLELGQNMFAGNYLFKNSANVAVVTTELYQLGLSNSYKLGSLGAYSFSVIAGLRFNLFSKTDGYDSFTGTLTDTWPDAPSEFYMGTIPRIVYRDKWDGKAVWFPFAGIGVQRSVGSYVFRLEYSFDLGVSNFCTKEVKYKYYKLEIRDASVSFSPTGHNLVFGISYLF